MAYPQDEIERMEKEKQIPTRLVVLDLEEKVIGYKVDTMWNLSKESEIFKVHPFEHTAPGKHLADNLLSGFNRYNIKDPSAHGTWFEKYSDGVIISVQKISESNFGKELLRYRVLREKNKYIAKRISP